MDYYEKTIDEKHIYKGNVIDISTQTVILPNGKKATRDIVKHPGAAVIIPISTNREIYLVEQYRKPIDRITLEIPAGKLDEGEEPIICAKRELKEETGLESKNIKHVASIHSTPGFSNEILHLFVATELTEGKSNADEDEFISSVKIPIEKALKMVLDGEITDSKTIIGVLLSDKIVKNEIVID
jgi:ADP-ribose pyrophosphatase